MTTAFRILPRLCAGLLPALACLLTLATSPASAQNAAPGATRAAARPTAQDASAIVAIVNGEVITMGDVDARRRLFAMSTGMGGSTEVLGRLTGQVLSQLIDERLRLHEIQRRNIVVSDQDIAGAIREIETRNNMPDGMLRQRLKADGVTFRTMVDQIRVQIGWGRLLREEMGTRQNVSVADLEQREAALKAQIGQTEYRISEIFVPISNPTRSDEANRFADTVIQQLRAGAPFQIVAAQFSQSQTALQGGDRGWVQGFELDPAVLAVVSSMPVGAVSNPIPVPGGLSIVTLHAQRQIGREQTVVLSVRQVFYKFPTHLIADQPTPAQREMVDRAQKLGASAHDCAAMEAAAQANGEKNNGDPGEVHLEGVQIPALRQLMASQPIGKASQPLIADDGVAVLMVCSRESKTLDLPNRKDLVDSIRSERFELMSRQMSRDLERRAVIDRRI